MANLLLSASQKTRLCGTLEADFTSQQFADFVWGRLRELPRLITRKQYPDNIADVIEWAEARSRTGELLRELHRVRPANSEIHNVWKEFRGEVVEALHDVFPSSDVGEVESIVNKSVPFEDVGKWLDRMARIRLAVCRIEPQTHSQSLDGYATGFLVGPGIVLTNYHVARNLLTHGRAVQTRIRFGYEVGTEGTSERSRVYSLADPWLLASSPVEELDYALLHLARAPEGSSDLAETQGFLRMKAHTFVRDEPLIILQHPSARPLKLAFGVVVSPTNGPHVTYNVNTEGGSSGSPCLITSLETVALHHWGGPNHNRGVRLGPILEHLRATGKMGLLDSRSGI